MNDISHLRRLFPCLCLFAWAVPAFVPAQGTFGGSVVVQWLEEEGDDRRMILLREFTFTDARGKEWQVPKGELIDGASIPSTFWSLVGPPFVGDYRRASVVHDHYCRRRKARWQEVHRMFFEACRAGGVSDGQAKIMYAAVYAGGPRWEDPSRTTDPKSLPTPAVDEGELKSLTEWIEGTGPDLSQIEERIGDLARRGP